MPARTEHEIKIKADARAVKTAGDEIRKAFSPMGAREFRRSVKDLERELKTLTGAQARLNRELERVERGSKAYKLLADELGKVEDKAKGVEKVVGSLNRAFATTQQRRQGFVAGLAQGTGISEYIPSGPGMGRRIGGAMLGRGIRRGAGGMAAPFMAPGMGGMSQALASIPGVGGAAAGALQMAGGYYQQAVGYSRARLQNLHFAGPQMGQAIMGYGKASAGNLSALQAANAQLSAAQRGDTSEMRTSIAAWEKSNPVPVAVRASRGEVGGSVGFLASGDLAKTAEDVFRTAKGLEPKHKAYQKHLRKWQAGRAETVAAQKKADVAAAWKAIDAADSGIERDTKLKRIGRRSGLGGLGMGAELGFDPTQVQQMMGGFFGARGGLATESGLGDFGAAMSAQVRYGISTQQSGAFARMGMAGGGGEGRGISEVMAGAIANKLEGSQIGEYLSTLVNLGQQAEQQGIKIDEREFIRATGLLGKDGLGLEGLQAQRVAGGLNTAAMGLSQKGASGAGDMLMLRAAGYDPSKGPLSYVRAINKLEKGFSGEGGTEILNNLLSTMVEGAGGGGEGADEMVAFHLKRRLSGLNVRVGAGQATKIIQGYRKTGQLDPEIMSRLKSQRAEAERDADSGQNRRELMASAKGLAGKGAGAAVTAAKLTGQQIGIGGQMGGLMVEMQKSSITTVKTLSNFRGGLTTAAGAVNGFISALNKFTQGDLIDKAMAALGIGESTPTPQTGGGGGR